MYKSLSCLFLLLCTIFVHIHAEDIIVLRNGDVIKAKVSEIDVDNVKYKKMSNLSGPNFVTPKSDILSITFENGDVEKFDNVNLSKSRNSSENDSPLFEEPVADYENHVIMAESNIRFSPNDFKAKKKKAKYGVPIMWFDESSIVSTSDISLRILGAMCPSEYGLYVMRYYIEITNKSNSPMYIDKAGSFKINDRGVATAFYDNRVINISHSFGSGMGIGLGGIANALGVGGIAGSIASGISVGGGNSHGSSTTYSDERVLMIPPGAKKYMSELKYEQIKGNEWKMISDAESYMIDVKPLQLNDGELREYSEINSPYKINYLISFSKDPSFRTYSTLKAGLYAKYILCKSTKPSTMKYIISYPEATQNTEDMFKIYSKIIPNFEELFGKIIVGRNYSED